MFKVELEALFNRVGEQLTLDRETSFGETSETGEPLFPNPVHIRGVIRNTAGVVYSDAVIEAELHTVCDRCAILDGQPCRFPEKMHPCVESHGINIIPTLEENGLEFIYGTNIVTWYSLLFF